VIGARGVRALLSKRNRLAHLARLALNTARTYHADLAALGPAVELR